LKKGGCFVGCISFLANKGLHLAVSSGFETLRTADCIVGSTCVSNDESDATQGLFTSVSRTELLDMKVWGLVTAATGDTIETLRTADCFVGSTCVSNDESDATQGLFTSVSRTELLDMKVWGLVTAATGDAIVAFIKDDLDICV
jgi:hypothetical protein